jgi:hypothetical protein
LRKNEYDDRGNLIGTRLFGVNGEPVAPIELGYHYIKTTFDEKGRALSESYFDTENQPSHFPQTTVHRAAFTNDELGRRVKTEYFQTDGSPGARRDGTHKFTQEYDIAGRSVKESYFGAPNAVPSPTPFLCLAFRRDEQGNVLERLVNNTKGEPINSAPDGRVHRTTFGYDGGGHAIEEAYFDADGKPALGASGVHKIVRVFDGYGNAIEVLAFDEQGEPASALGKHRIVFVFDGKEVVKESYFDAKGQPVARNGLSGRRKESGKLVELDESGNPIQVVRALTLSSPPFKGGPGDMAGLRAGDIILAYENWRFPLDEDDVDWNRAYDGLIEALQANGDTPRRLVVLRDGRLLELSATSGPLQVRLMSEPSSRSWLGAAAKELSQR